MQSNYSPTPENKKCVAENEMIGKKQAIEKKHNEPIAIIGMSGKFPNADNLMEFWNNLKNGVDCIGEYPEKRRNLDNDFLFFVNRDKEINKYITAGYLNAVDLFDYDFFNISPKEASLMDPDQRLFLTTAWEAIENAGYGGDKIKGTKTGVFVGHIAEDSVYKQIVSEVIQDHKEIALLGNLSSLISSRLSYFLNLKGPSIVIDTACSSSLVAIHTACNSIFQGDCDLAIVGGVRTLILPTQSHIKIGIESPEGRSKAFSEDADGTGSGEGVGVVVLKKLSSAQRDRDTILAVIKGSAVNQDGKSIGLTAPNVLSQENLITGAWISARIDPETISFIETHGTGTKLGDSVEIEGIKRAFSYFTDKKQFCAIASVKSNIGHLFAASGIASLIKAVCCLQNRQIVKSMHSEKSIVPNDFPIYVNNKLTKWENDQGPLRCGVSSFGFNGTNSHVVLEEAPLNPRNNNDSGLHIFSLTAKNKKVLTVFLERFYNYLSNNNEYDISDICYSINTGRGQYDYRIAFIVKNYNELIEKIAVIIERGFDVHQTGVFYSNNLKINDDNSKNILNTDTLKKTERNSIEIIDEYINGKSENINLAEDICGIFVSGNYMDWDRLYKCRKLKKVPLPTYPFDLKQAWIDIPKKRKQNQSALSIFQLLEKTRVSEEFLRELDLLSKKYAIDLLQENKTEKQVVLTGRNTQIYSEIEKIIGEIWAKELGYYTININDHFLKSGGDSIFALRVANEIARRLNININIKEILNYPTFGGLAEYIEKTYQSKEVDNRSFIEPLRQEEYYQTSAAQKRLYILNEFENAELNYNMPFSIAIDGDVDFDRFEEIFKKLIQRHEILRTTFHFVEGMPIQKIHNTTSFSIKKLKSTKEALQQTIQDFIQPFSLSSYPLIRVAFIRIAENQHVLLIDMHHMIADGTSMGIILRDFAFLYSNRELPSLKIQYKDFANWQNKFLQQAAMKKQKEYWVSLFSDTIPVLNLQTDFKRPLIQTFKGERINFFIDRELTLQLKNIAQQMETTYFMILLALYTILLSKYTSQDDIVIGTPISGRQYPGVENIVGMFVNILAIRNYPETEKPFDIFLREVKNNVLQAFDNQDYQFEELVEELSPNRELGRNPIFDAVFVLQNQELYDIRIEGLTFSSFKTENVTSKFDLLLEAIERDGNTYFTFEYSTSLFKKNTIDRLASHFISCIQCVIKNDSIKIIDIDLLKEAEKKRLLNQYNDFNVDYPQTTIQQLFETQVKQHPDKSAVIQDKKGINYQDLNREANKLAQYLRKKGVQPNSIVAIMPDRSVDLIIGMLAIIKAGGGYLPIDPDYPDDRVNFMLSDSQAQYLLTKKEYSGKFNFSNTIIYFEDSASWENESSENISCVNKPEDLLYIIYTSGTTGKPKGTMIEHRNVAQLLFNNKFLFRFDFNDTWTMFHSFCFDFSVWEIYGSLLYGGQLIIIPKMIARDYKKFLSIIKENNVTVLNQTPGAFYNLIQEELKESDNNLKLRYVIFGGEALKPTKLKEWREKYPEIELINMYGITETTVHVTFKRITQYEIDNNISNIGKPLPAYTGYIMDKKQNLVPFGVPGELCVGGAGVARGYLNRPELTKEKFIINPYNQNERLYRSGDLVMVNEDGEMIYLGRIDHQIKIRGFRIELGEIESQLLKLPFIKEAVVQVREIKQDNKALIAYLVPKSSNYNEQMPAIQSSLEQNQVHNWEQVFEENYKKNTDQQDLTFNINGWISSYTNSQIPANEMKEWLDTTVERILSQKPNNILEIGCGTGMLLFRVAPLCKNYAGVDFSEQAIQYIKFVTSKLNLDLMNVELHNRCADDFDNLALPPIDMVIINSVIQYFPDHHYLLNVLDKMIPLFSNRESVIFLGDIRNNALVENFHASVVLHQENKIVNSENIYKKIQQSISQDFELSIDPAFFYKLKHIYPQITDVEIYYKKTTHFNEMSAFRYDVVIHLNKPYRTIKANEIRWENGTLIDSIIESISTEKPEVIEITNIPHQWLYKTAQDIENLKSKKDIVNNTRENIAELPEIKSMLPKQFLEKCPGGYSCEVLWDGPEKDIYFRVRYSRISGSEKENHFVSPVFDIINYPYKEFNDYCSHPLKQRINQQIKKETKEFLTQHLPDYMVPNYFILMDNIPLTSNGKINSQALPNPEFGISSIDSTDEPANEIEKKISIVWMEILGLDRIGIHDNFFNFGGNSLTAIQMLYQLQENFTISTNDVFLYPTISELAKHISFKKDNLKNRIVTATNFYKNLPVKEILTKNELHGSFSDYLSLYENELNKKEISLVKKDKNILLTGATGYLGIHILIELLANYQETIFVLVRGQNAEDALQRLKHKLDFYAPFNFYEQYKDRIKVICGDITLENFGIDPKTFNYLANNIDSIINTAANVKHFGTHEDFYVPNVKFVERLILFAKTIKDKRIFHISSSGVAYGKINQKETVLFTEYDSDLGQTIDNFYMQSKLEAEQLILRSREEGLDATILRVGNLTFHSQNGHFQENINDNGFYKLIASLLRLKVIPDISLKVFDLSFIDAVSRSVSLLTHCSLKAETYHIFNPYKVSYPELAALLNNTGYSIKTENVETYFNFIYNNYQNKEIRPWIDNILLHSYLFENMENTYFEFVGNRTMFILDKLGFCWNQVTQKQIDMMIRYGRTTNFFAT